MDWAGDVYGVDDLGAAVGRCEAEEEVPGDASGEGEGVLFVAVELVLVAEAAASGASGVGTGSADAALRSAGEGVEPVLL